MDCWRAERMSEPFSIEQPHARTRTGADDDQGAMRGGTAQPFVLPTINRLGRQLGDENSLLVAAEAKGAGHAVGAGKGSVECRHARDALAIQLQVTSGRV